MGRDLLDLGALWLTDPKFLLPNVRDRLTPGGKLVFSHAPPVPDSYGIQGMYGNGFNGRQVWIYRWAYEPSTWADLLHEHGFVDIYARIEPAPQPGNIGTLVVEARRERWASRRPDPRHDEGGTTSGHGAATNQRTHAA